MEITFLGTGAGLPSKNRNVSAIVLNLLAERNELWLFDCGEATQHQLLYTTLKPRKINKIFITHLHGDHIFGLPGFLSSRSFQGGDSPLTIYGPVGIRNFVETALHMSQTHVTYPIYFEEFSSKKIIYQSDDFTVEAKTLDHGVLSFAYLIKETDKLGALKVEELRDLGIQPGTIFQKIKENETTILDDGKIIERKDYVGPTKKGKKIVIFGDTRYKQAHAKFAMDADVLVHEATFAANMDELAKSYYHTTTIQAAQLAKDANVQTLIMTHISSRYQKEDTNGLLQEARAVFPFTFIADDFYTYTIQ